MRVISSLCAAVLIATTICSAQNPPAKPVPRRRAKPAAVAPLATAPEAIYFNAIIYTGEGLAEDKPQVVQAMAIGGGKALAIGTTEEITRLARPKNPLHD